MVKRFYTSYVTLLFAVHTAFQHKLQPGPQDPPGPRYESYDSGPSFGNMGPLPEDYSGNPAAMFNSTWNVNRLILPCNFVSSKYLS